jgi:restriction system protein
MSDLAGHKLGIVAGEVHMRDAVAAEGLEEYWPEDMNATYRLRSEVVEAIAAALLTYLGDPHAADRRPIGLALHKEFSGLPEGDAVLAAISANLPRLTEKPGPKGFDPRPFLDALEESLGPLGLVAGTRTVELFNARLLASPWSRVRRREWSDVAELERLFQSQGLLTTYGQFFDQRFIDFLGANFAQIDNINWRQFEALAAEWFLRAGYIVELGPGSDDDGVDIRAWPDNPDEGAPPVLIAQCKRQKNDIEKVVVKALHTDVLYEGAEKGVVVTTSRFASGTARVNHERGYQIEEASREVIRDWIAQLRTPGTGVFLAE